MKALQILLIAIGLLFFSCEKVNSDDEQNNEVNVGGLYFDYTQVIENTCDIVLNISGEDFSFNKSEAIYSSHQPTTNQNVFMIRLSDTISGNKIGIDIFTPFIIPEDFFSETTFAADTIKISWQGVREDFYGSNVLFAWNEVTFNNHIFSGIASFEITNEIVGTINTETYYPLQEVDFKFE